MKRVDTLPIRQSVANISGLVELLKAESEKTPELKELVVHLEHATSSLGMNLYQLYADMHYIETNENTL